MSQRQRQASGGMSAVLPALAEAQPASSAVLSSPCLAVDRDTSPVPSWEELFQNASPAQQAELLALARRQGVVYAHRLPLATGPRCAETGTELTRLAVLTRLLAGKVDDLEVVRPAEITCADAALDERQREAVARALATPDVCLVQGLPGSGKSRVVAEILTQTALRGQRALFLAPTAAPLDAVLARLAEHGSVCALRVLGAGESLDGLPPASRALTAAEQDRRLREETVVAARQARTEAEEQGKRRGQEHVVWGQLLEFAQARQGLDEQLADLDRRRAALSAEVEAQADQLLRSSAPAGSPGRFGEILARATQAYEGLRRHLDVAHAEAVKKRDAAREELTSVTARREALQPLAEAKRRGRWWSILWWRATLQGKVLVKADALAAQQRQVAEALERLEADAALATRSLQAADQAFQQECRLRHQEEVCLRQAELADQDTALSAELRRLDEKWAHALARLLPDTVRPEAPTAAGVQKAREAWQAQRARDEQSRELACQWAAYLETSAGELAGRLRAYANVVAAPLTALTPDGHLGAAGNGDGLYDLLVVEEAERISEADLLRAARRARRWVLVGEPSWLGESAPREAAGLRSRSRPRAAPAALQASCFQRLWAHLHCDPSRLPYVWARENNRLCCRLYPVPLEQRNRLETESVADFPEVELRILNLPRATPVLAEVVFPPAITIQQAKTYIFRELQELPVQALGPTVYWVERPDAVILELCGCQGANAAAVPLEDGVTEVVIASACSHAARTAHSPAWHTSRLEFDRRLAWDRERAEAWVNRHLRLRDLGRTACLNTIHRMTAPLTAVLSEVLWRGAGEPASAAMRAAAPAHAMEFVAVPPLDPRAPRDRARAGAGLEVDLAGPRRSDRLPSDLRALLPTEGVVNYLEAQAVVRRLSRLVRDPALRASCPQPAIAVIALYPAQVALLRELMRRSNLPREAAAAIEVGLPDAFRQRECQAALVSLTRSHSHRAVPFGAHPDQVCTALTRARSRLIIFGDHGTLARRAQWQGALDHLDDQAGTREGRVIAALVRYVQGEGRHAGAFRLAAGDGP
jgi:hypothetical protein